MPLEASIDFDLLDVESLSEFYAEKAVHLEGFIKGALDGSAPQRRSTFNDLRAFVAQSKKLIRGQSVVVEEPENQAAALALIDFFANPQNTQRVLEHYQLEDYQIIHGSLTEPEQHDFLAVDDQILPTDLAQKWGQLIADYQAQVSQTITIASGFRSPAYQLYLMVTGSYRKINIEGKKINLEAIFSILAPPYCSKHSIAGNPAIDVVEFFPGQKEALGKTCAEVRDHPAWIQFKEIAAAHGFKENYPIGSKPNQGQGESWEFQYRPDY
ncbi:hypothetical protein GW756_00985 [bacterium]|nr:hypothetical protein [bacterium]NCQ54932.1 hypothetical protein [Candidatus Parcubacteria bacterium]NCS66976.1 hypothetical protein [Candidatus Peregrinibacteria bacterium]NCS95922.1 hypothetical protein [bacterium]